MSRVYLAVLYDYRKMYEKSFEMLQMHIDRKDMSNHVYTTSMLVLGDLYIKNNDAKKARKIFFKVLKNQNQIDGFIGKAMSLVGISKSYLIDKKYSLSKIYLEKSRRIYGLLKVHLPPNSMWFGLFPN